MVEFQADNAQLVRSTGANVSVMVLQGPKFIPQKSRPLESGHRRYGVRLAIKVKTRGDQLPTDGPDHTTRPKGHHSGQW